MPGCAINYVTLYLATWFDGLCSPMRFNLHRFRPWLVPLTNKTCFTSRHRRSPFHMTNWLLSRVLNRDTPESLQERSAFAHPSKLILQLICYITY